MSTFQYNTALVNQSLVIVKALMAYHNAKIFSAHQLKVALHSFLAQNPAGIPIDTATVRIDLSQAYLIENLALPKGKYRHEILLKLFARNQACIDLLNCHQAPTQAEFDSQLKALHSVILENFPFPQLDVASDPNMVKLHDMLRTYQQENEYFCTDPDPQVRDAYYSQKISSSSILKKGVTAGVVLPCVALLFTGLFAPEIILMAFPLAAIVGMFIVLGAFSVADLKSPLLHSAVSESDKYHIARQIEIAAVFNNAPEIAPPLPAASNTSRPFKSLAVNRLYDKTMEGCQVLDNTLERLGFDFDPEPLLKEIEGKPRAPSPD
jgi:hypothetical protein